MTSKLADGMAAMAAEDVEAATCHKRRLPVKKGGPAVVIVGS